MRHILVYADSLSWGIIPGTRRRHPFKVRWPGAPEINLNQQGQNSRVIEDSLNGRRTVWDDPFKPGRNGLQGLQQRIEIHSPLALVILMLGSNDFQSMHPHNAWHASQGIATLVAAIRNSPVEPGMPIPEILLLAPPSIEISNGDIAPKFAGGSEKCVGLADAYRKVSEQLSCRFIDTGKIISASSVDGVHLDAEDHVKLGEALVPSVAELLPPN